MSATGVLAVRVAGGGRVLDVVDAAGVLVASLAFAVPGEAVEGWEPDGEELLLTHGRDVTGRLRSSFDGRGWTLTLTVDNTSAEPVELPYLGLGVMLGPGRVGWAFTSDLEGLVAVVSGEDASGGVLLRLRQGFLRATRDVPAFEDAAELAPGERRGLFHLSPPDGMLGGHRRHQVVLDLRPLDDLADATAVLPAWLPPTIVRAGAEIDVALPDRAIIPEPGVTATVVDTNVLLGGVPGHHRVAIHGPRGVDRVGLTWAPDVRDLVPDVVASLVRRPAGRASAAAGYLVAHASALGMSPDPEAALDWLDQVDWLDRGTLLGDATAGVLAAHVGERRQLDGVWRFLDGRPVTPGYGLVVMRIWLAALGSLGEPDVRASGLLRREAPDVASALELELLTDRDAVRLDAPLTGLIQTLGGVLPGRPLALSASEAARTISLLRLCPESWRHSREAADAAGKAEGLLLADYARDDPEGPRPPRSLDGLAWLLLGELGI